VDVTSLEGVAGGAIGISGMGDGAVWGDTDNDGDLDLYVAQGAGPAAFSTWGPALFLRNDGDRGNSIQIELVGRDSGVIALGATATVVAGGQTITRALTANSWRGFQDPLRIHVGIGGAAVADTVRVDWPSGIVHEYLNVSPGVYRLRENLVVLDSPLSTAAAGGGWSLSRPRPQPSRGSQSLAITASSDLRVELAVYDVAGRLVQLLHDGMVPRGETTFIWDGRDRAGRPAPSGVYFLRARADRSIQTWKSVRVR